MKRVITDMSALETDTTKRDKVNPDLDKNIPIVTLVDVPSKFKSYPNDCQISYRPYSWGEVRKDSQSKLSEIDIMKHVMEGITTSFPILNLTLSDFYYIALLRKISTIDSSVMQGRFVCEKPKCYHLNPFRFEESSLEFQDISAPEIPVNATIKGTSFSFYPLTVGQYIYMLEKDLGNDDMAGITLMTSYFKDEIDDDEFLNYYEFFASLVGKSVHKAEQVASYLYHSIEPKIIKCSKCATKNTVEVDGGKISLRPFRDDTVNKDDGISFGTSSQHTPDKSD